MRWRGLLNFVSCVTLVGITFQAASFEARAPASSVVVVVVVVVFYEVRAASVADCMSVPRLSFLIQPIPPA